MPSACQLLGCTACWCCIDSSQHGLHSSLLLTLCSKRCVPASTAAPTDRPAPNALKSPSAAAVATARAAPSMSPSQDVSATIDTARPAAWRCFSGSRPHMSGQTSVPAQHCIQSRLQSVSPSPSWDQSRALVLAMLRLLLPGLGNSTRPTPAAAPSGDRPDAAWPAAKSAANTNITTYESVCARCMFERSQRLQLARARYFLDISAR